MIQEERNDLISVVEKLLKFGALFGIFGYISARAHWNHLGISSMTWLGVDYYLMEFGIFLITSLLNLSLFMPVLILVGAAFSAFRQRRRHISSAEPAITGGWFVSYGGSLTITILLYVYQFGLLAYLEVFSRQSVAVGVLSAGSLAPTSPAIADWAIFYVTISACVGAYALQRLLTPETGPSAAALRWIRGLLILASVMLFVWAPLIYGSLLRISRYPLVKIETTDSKEETIVGLLVLNTSDGIEYWRAVDRVGEMVLIPHDRIESISLEKTYDLCELAAYASQHNGKFPKQAIRREESQ